MICMGPCFPWCQSKRVPFLWNQTWFFPRSCSV